MTIQTFYFIYRTTNLVNGKIYVGKHKTKRLNDGYVGSGKLLKRAISKYGRENFKTEILEWFSSEVEMNARETELVTEEFCLRDDTYNLCVGGCGGFSFINRNNLSERDAGRHTQRLRREAGFKARVPPNRGELRREQYRLGLRKRPKGGYMEGKTHSNETKAKISAAKKITSKGERNSQFGSMWITDGILNKKQKAVDPIPLGWYKGRK